MSTDGYRSACFRVPTLTRTTLRLPDCRVIVLAATAAVLCAVADLPRVTGLPPRLYLTHGLTGRLDCPVDANPPVTIILWSKNGVMVDDDDGGGPLMGGGGGGGGRRLRTSRDGTLFIRSVEKTDEGRYVCTPYSPLGKGQASMPVQVFIRGQSDISHYGVCALCVPPLLFCFTDTITCGIRLIVIHLV